MARTRRPAPKRRERKGPRAPAQSDAASPRFEGQLQHLIADFLRAHSQDSDEIVASLQRLFSALAYELGRVDGTIRLQGVSRLETLRLLREGMLTGKHATLSAHAQHCSACEASKLLQDEVESN